MEEVKETLQDIATALQRAGKKVEWPRFNPAIESFGQFVQRVNEFANARGLNEVDAMNALPMMLPQEGKDSLRKAIEELRAEEAEQTWRSVCERFVLVYYTTEKRLMAQAELARTKQGEKSVDDYSKHCQFLVAQAHPEDKAARKAALKSCFLRGLKPHLQAAVLRLSLDDVASMIAEAKREEAIQRLIEPEQPILNAIEALHSTIANLQLNKPENHQEECSCTCNCHGQNREFTARRGRGQGRGRGRWNGPRRGAGSSRGMLQVSPIFAPITIMIALAILPIVSSEKVFFCSDQGGIYLTPEENQNCPEFHPDVVLQTKIEVFELNQTVPEITAFRCTEERYTECQDYTFFFQSGLNRTLTNIAPLTVEDCRKATETLNHRESEYEKITENTYVKYVGRTNIGRNFFGETCDSWKRIVLLKTELTEVANRIVSPDFTNDQDCRMEEEVCVNSGATLIWKAEEKELHCDQLILLGTFESIISKDRIVIESMQISLIANNTKKAPERLKSCRSNSLIPTVTGSFVSFPYFPHAQSTEEIWRQARRQRRDTFEHIITASAATPDKQLPSYSEWWAQQQKSRSIAETTKGTTRSSLMAQKNVETDQNDAWREANYLQSRYEQEEASKRNLTMKGLNAKLQYTSDSMVREMWKHFSKLSKDFCHLANRQASIWKAILRIDATVGVRSLFGRNDLKAKPIGQDVYKVTYCKEVKVRKTWQNGEIEGVCYEQTPIETENGKILFVDNGSSDAKETGQQIDCNARKEMIDFANETQTLNVRVGTNTLEKPMPIQFEAGDIFDKAKGSSFPLQLAIQLRTNLASFQKSQELIVKPVKRNITEILPSLRGIAEAAGYVIDSASGTVKSAMNEIKSWYTKYIFYVGLPVLVSAALIFISYIGCRMLIVSKIGGASLPINAALTDELDEIELPMIKQTTAEKKITEMYQKQSETPLMTFVPTECAVFKEAPRCSLKPNLPFIVVSIFNRKVIGLWDSGAAVSYTRSSTIAFINAPKKWMKPVVTTAWAANGSKIDFQGKITLMVQIANHCVEHEFFVSADEDCPAGLILGYDFMATLHEKGIETSLKPSDGTLRVGNKEVPIFQGGQLPFRLSDETIRTNSRKTTIQKRKRRILHVWRTRKQGKSIWNNTESNMARRWSKLDGRRKGRKQPIHQKKCQQCRGHIRKRCGDSDLVFELEKMTINYDEILQAGSKLFGHVEHRQSKQ